MGEYLNLTTKPDAGMIAELGRMRVTKGLVGRWPKAQVLGHFLLTAPMETRVHPTKIM